jgi:tetratricopeptide (TPR) repeat protein
MFATETLTPATLPSALEEARRHHAQNHLLQAAKAYRQALIANPRSQPALLGLSLIARQSNQPEPALRMAVAALAAGTASAVAWANFGDALIALHHTARAKAAFRRAIILQPSLAAARFGLGNALALEENYPEALTHFTIAAEHSPRCPECHFAQAFAQGKLGIHGKAIAAYRRAVQLRPRFASAWLNLGVELVADGRSQLADHCYRQALKACYPLQHENRPDWIDTHANTRISAHLNLGHLHRSRRHFIQAQHHYEAALAVQSDLAETRLAEIQIAFTYLHLEQKQFPQAWQSLHQAEIALLQHPNPEVPNARGILLLAEPTAQSNFDLPLIEEAIQAFEQAESQGHKTAPSNRGNALLRLGRCEEALTAQLAALERDPHHPGVRYNLALTQLRTGDFIHGWPNYEIRWQFREVHPNPRRFSQPRWQGEHLSGVSRLLIYSEQGLGDTLQFLRYLPLVAQRSPEIHLILEVQPPLVRLLTPYLTNLQTTSPGVTAEILPHGHPLPPFTHHCPLLSLPAVFQTTLDTIPTQIPYLKADPQLSQQRASELAAIGDPNHPAIGIAWAGNPNYRADQERSTILGTLLPLLKIPSIRWISLQKGESTNQIHQLPPDLIPGFSLTNASSRDQDLADTAALVTHLDLVITTDTVIAHLAGALGKPLWLLLPWQSDWRWMQHMLTTPWYPHARLFRQSSLGNWPELLDRVAHQLQDWRAMGCSPLVRSVDRLLCDTTERSAESHAPIYPIRSRL